MKLFYVKLFYDKNVYVILTGSGALLGDSGISAQEITGSPEADLPW